MGTGPVARAQWRHLAAPARADRRRGFGGPCGPQPRSILNTATVAARFGQRRTGSPSSRPKASRMRRPLRWASTSKSAKYCRRGCWCVVPPGRAAPGHRHAAAQHRERLRQWAKFGKLTMPMRPTCAVSRSMCSRLQVLRVELQHHVEARPRTAPALLQVELHHVHAASAQASTLSSRSPRRSRCSRWRAQVASSSPLPQPRSSTRAPRAPAGDDLQILAGSSPEPSIASDALEGGLQQRVVAGSSSRKASCPCGASISA